MDSAYGHLGFSREWIWAISTLVVRGRMHHVWGLGADAAGVGVFSPLHLCLMIWDFH